MHSGKRNKISSSQKSPFCRSQRLAKGAFRWYIGEVTALLTFPKQNNTF